jgi:hypothetical protein
MMMAPRRIVNPRTVDDFSVSEMKRSGDDEPAAEIICRRNDPEKKKSRAHKSPA